MRRPGGCGAAGLVALAVLAGCTHVQSETRVERGPALRTFEREGPVTPGGVEATATARWPRLTLALATFEVCREEQVEEYIEERTTEVTAPSAGPALGTGVAGTLVGAGLLASRGLFPDQPDTRRIDATGHYGPSQRQIATGWGVVFLTVGVPALTVAVLELAQTGVRTESRKVQSVMSSVQAHCRHEPVSGRLVAADGKVPPLEVRDGAVELSPEVALALDPGALRLDGREVELSPAARVLVETFRACARALPVPAAEELGALKVAVLAERLEDARACAKVPDAPAAEAAAAYERELAARLARGETVPEGPRVERFEDAVAAYAPKLRLMPGSPDLELLKEPEKLTGQAVLVRGILQAWVEPNIARVEVGPHRVWMFVDGGAMRMGAREAGTRVEAVAVGAGRQMLGAQDLPLLRAIWVRPAM